MLYLSGAKEVLEEVVCAVRSSPVNPNCEVYIDGGVRRGRDIVRAVALGATAVFVGRPVFWGLALGGQAGVERMIEMFRECVADLTIHLAERCEFTRHSSLVKEPGLIG